MGIRAREGLESCVFRLQGKPGTLQVHSRDIKMVEPGVLPLHWEKERRRRWLVVKLEVMAGGQVVTAVGRYPEKGWKE